MVSSFDCLQNRHLSMFKTDGCVSVDSSSNSSFRIHNYSNSSYEVVDNTEKKEKQKEVFQKIKKYLENKKLTKIKTGWVNPQKEIVCFDEKRKQPIFKNFAVNSNRGS